MKTLFRLLKVFATPVLSIVLISIFSDLAWALVQSLGMASAPTAFAIDAATIMAVTATLFGWVFSLPNDIADALKLEENLR